MNVSIVIPVYNEAEHLAACLEAIATQTVAPYEVLVVDNNSTDNSAAIAERYAFVTVLRESRQGVVFARDRGFNATGGDIIGRIDADSLIAPDWVASIQHIFAGNTALAATTGKVRYYGLALSGVLDTIDLRLRRHLARLLGSELAMQGANMAVRRTAWQQVETQLCRTAGLHEDHDIGIHLSCLGYDITFDERLVTAIDCRRVQSSWLDFCRYAWLSPKTYALHDLDSRRHMYPIVWLAVVCHSPLKLLARGYNPVTERFSWRQLFGGPLAGRVNPATFVD